MNYRIQVLNNGYTLTSSKPIAGKGDVIEERLVFVDKDALLNHLRQSLPKPSAFTRQGSDE